MQKFLVVSYDDDQQQWFWDFVVAPRHADAVAQVCKDRPYVIAADATPLPFARRTLATYGRMPVAKIRANYKRTIQEA